MKRPVLVLLSVLMLGLVAGCTEKVTSTVAVNSPDYSTLPEKKQTKLGLYLTAAEAYDNWKADPENIVVLDVRTPEEYIFVGHPEMAWNVPFKIATCETVDGQPGLVMKTTPDFIERAKKVVKPTDTIYVICRSGGRSAAVVNLLAEKGFKNAYNIIDGFEGDKVKDPKNANHGKRAINGWRNAGRPWTYDLVPEKMLLPAEILKPEAPKTE